MRIMLRLVQRTTWRNWSLGRDASYQWAHSIFGKRFQASVWTMGTRNPQCFLVWHLHTVKYFVHRRNGKIHFGIETEDLRQKMAFGLCMDTISSERNLLCESIDILFSKGHLKDTMPLLPDIEFSMSGSEATGARPKDFFAVGSLNARDVISRSGHFPFAKEARQHVSLPVRCSRELFIDWFDCGWRFCNETLLQGWWMADPDQCSHRLEVLQCCSLQ